MSWILNNSRFGLSFWSGSLFFGSSCGGMISQRYFGSTCIEFVVNMVLINEVALTHSVHEGKMLQVVYYSTPQAQMFSTNSLSAWHFINVIQHLQLPWSTAEDKHAVFSVRKSFQGLLVISEIWNSCTVRFSERSKLSQGFSKAGKI